jgi:hypothetical protein
VSRCFHARLLTDSVNLITSLSTFSAGYEARQKLLTYCTDVVNENLNSKQVNNVEALDLNRQSPVLGLFEEEVLVS